MKYFFLLIFFLMFSCKSTEQKFKKHIISQYKNKSICFRIDQSEQIGSFGVRLFEKKEYKSSNANSFSNNFERAGNCELVALSGKINDSIYVSIIYPFKENIDQTLSEYQKWYYKGKIYYYKKNLKGLHIDTISIQTNPPIINPRNTENIGRTSEDNLENYIKRKN